MRVKFLPSSQRDLDWMQSYYNRVFPAGKKQAAQGYLQTKQIIKENPFIGRRLEDNSDIREFQIVKTPFAFIYVVKDTHIEILRVWDQRRDPVALNLDI